MIIRFFKADQPASILFLPLLAIAVWVFAFDPVQGKAYTGHAMPLFELMVNLAGGNEYIQMTIALVALLAGTAAVHIVADRQELLGKRSYLPAFLYLVLMSGSPRLTCLHPALFANIFILVAFHRIMSSYRKDTAFMEAFDAGFWIAIASLFYFPAIVFLLLPWISFLILRPFIWREWVIVAVGALVPYLFAGVYYFWFDISEYLWFDKMIYPLTGRQFRFEGGWPELAYAIAVAALVLISLARYVLVSGARKHRTKNAFAIMATSVLVTVLSLLTAPYFALPAISFVFVPFSVFMAGYFLYIKRTWMAEILFLTLVAMIVYNHLAAV